jgi:Holliday junction resolvase-like predicted endonuclease
MQKQRKPTLTEDNAKIAAMQADKSVRRQICFYQSAYRKKLGKWGERQLDRWMAQQGWSIAQKNLRVQGGEIDRIYRQISQENVKFCLAEVKTNVVAAERHFFEIFSEVGLKKYIKQRQMTNLYRYGEHLLASTNAQVMLRLFLILKMKKETQFPLHPQNTEPLKLCWQGEGVWIFSLVPEFTPVLARKSLVQMRVK